MSRRGLVIALIVSLAVNLFVIGGLAGAAMMGLRPHGALMGPPGPPRLSAMGEALGAEHQEAWRNTLRQAAETSRPRLQEARALRREAWQALAKDPVDVQAALTALGRSREVEQSARAEMDRAVAGFVATLSAPERQRLVDALSRERPHGRLHGGPPWSGGSPGGPRGEGDRAPNG